MSSYAVIKHLAALASKARSSLESREESSPPSFADATLGKQNRCGARYVKAPQEEPESSASSLKHAVSSGACALDNAPGQGMTQGHARPHGIYLGANDLVITLETRRTHVSPAKPLPIMLRA
jgi:hypothetical protein